MEALVEVLMEAVSEDFMEVAVVEVMEAAVAVQEAIDVFRNKLFISNLFVYMLQKNKEIKFNM